MYIITGLLGLAFVLAPFLLNYEGNAAALWTSLVGGVMIMLLSYFEGIADDKERWEYVTAAVVGVGTVIAPFILGFEGFTAAMVTSVVIGTLLFIIAGTKLYLQNTVYH